MSDSFRRAFDSSTLAVLFAILFVTAATELWAPVVPEIIDSGWQGTALRGSWQAVLLIAVYGSLKDLLEAINYFAGGWIAGRFGTRRALLIFNALPLCGLGLLLLRPTWWAALAAVPLVFIWDSISGPATLTVVGDSLAPERRTMAFSMQALFRRLSRLVAYGTTGVLLWVGGVGLAAEDSPLVGGFRSAVLAGVVMVLAAFALQWRLLRTRARDVSPALRSPVRTIRGFAPGLRRLLWADVAARWAEGVPRELIILYAVGGLVAQGMPDHRAVAFYTTGLLGTQAVVNGICYLVVGVRASRPGAEKQPYIAATFLFFALFPLALALAPDGSRIALAAAFVVGGLREVGEPARKALITEWVPADHRTQAIGAYWGVRSLCVFLAPLGGGAIWIAGDAIHPRAGARSMLVAAGVAGLAGALAYARQSRPRPTTV